jgi:hypothetical protein
MEKLEATTIGQKPTTTYDLEPLDHAYICDMVVLLTSGAARTKSALARKLGIASRKVERLLNHPDFKKKYEEVTDQHTEDCLQIALDEKMDPIRRAHALRAKAQSTMAHALDHLQARIEDKKSADPDALSTSAAEFRAAAAVIKLALDDSRAHDDRGKVAKSVHVHAHFNPSERQKQVFSDTFKEAEIDLGDMADGWRADNVIDAEVPQPTNDTGHPQADDTPEAAK